LPASEPVKPLVISAAARADLEDIGRHTERERGGAARRRYLSGIREHFTLLHATPGVGTPRDDIRPGYRSVVAGRHVVYYRETPDVIEIVRVLHERMDMHRRLRDERDEGPR